MPARPAQQRLSTAATAAAADGLAGLFSQQRLTLLLERAVGERKGADEVLWHSGAFAAEVYPDLPVATTWQELLPRSWRSADNKSASCGSSSGIPSSSSNAMGSHHQPACQAWRVQTVAAQLRWGGTLRQLLLEAALGSWPADAVLLVSGSHPARMLPGASRFLYSSFDSLHLAADMRAAGELPATLSLWAVENPLLNPVHRLRQKADAGAEVVLTQPPLLWEHAAAWVHAAAEAGISQQLKLVVGMPMVSSASNLDFWLRLCSIRNKPGAEEVLASFPSDPAAIKAWNADLVRRTVALPGVAGLHVMPLTGAARRMTRELLEEGVFMCRDRCSEGGK